MPLLRSLYRTKLRGYRLRCIERRKNYKYPFRKRNRKTIKEISQAEEKEITEWNPKERQLNNVNGFRRALFFFIEFKNNLCLIPHPLDARMLIVSKAAQNALI